MFVLFCSNLAYNIFHGYLLIPPFKLDEPISFVTLKHPLDKDISISYPSNWKVYHFPRGNHGDREVLARIDPGLHSLPNIEIAYSNTEVTSLDEVAIWGESKIGQEEYESLSLEKITINHRDALLRRYTYQAILDIPFLHCSYKIYCNHIYFVNGKDGFTVEMCVDKNSFTNEMRSVFNQMAYSVSFSE